MEPQTQKNQIVELLRASENLVITVSQRPDSDQISAAIGLAEILHKLNKHADVVISGAVPSNLSYLSTGLVKKSFSGIRDFVIDVDTSTVEADKLRYVPEGKKLRIYVTPFNGNYSADDVDFSYGDYHCDAVIALGVDTQEQMDKQITNQKELLSKTKLVTLNIGDGSGGAGLNWHVATASSICELVMTLLESMQPDILDADIATSLLTGIISKTDHFTNERTSAKVMNIASQLMAVGAKQTDIIEHLKKPVDAPSEPDSKDHKPVARPLGEKPKSEGELESGQVQELPHKGKKLDVDEAKSDSEPEPKTSAEQVPPPIVNSPLQPVSGLTPINSPPLPPKPMPTPTPPPLQPIETKPADTQVPKSEPVAPPAELKPPINANPVANSAPPLPSIPSTPAQMPLPPLPKPPIIKDVQSESPLVSTAPPPLSPLGVPSLPPLPPSQPGDVAQPNTPLALLTNNAPPPIVTAGSPSSVSPDIPLGPDGKPDIEAARRAVEEAERNAPAPPPPPVNPPSNPVPPPPPANPAS